MAKLTLEQIYENKVTSGVAVDKAQSAMNDLSSQQVTASKALADAKTTDDAAETTLVKAVSQVPADTLPVTKDGKGLVLVGGSLHAMNTTDAVNIVFDDGSEPAPGPAPSPSPTPGPAPSPSPEPSPAPAPASAPVPAPAPSA